MDSEVLEEQASKPIDIPGNKIVSTDLHVFANYGSAYEPFSNKNFVQRTLLEYKWFF